MGSVAPLPSAPIAAQSRLVKASVHSGVAILYSVVEQFDSGVGDTESLVGMGRQYGATLPIGPGGTQATSTDSLGGRTVVVTALGVVGVVDGAAVGIGVVDGTAIGVDDVGDGAADGIDAVDGTAIGIDDVGDGAAVGISVVDGVAAETESETG